MDSRNKRPFWLPGVIGAAALAATSAAAPAQQVPATPRDEMRESLHGVEIADPYRWLEDQDSPETRAWINEQNQYSQTVLSTLPGRDAIHKRLEQLLKIDTIGIPSARGDRYFYSKRLATQNQSV